MKTLLTKLTLCLLACLCGMSLLTSCGGNPPTPRERTKQFLNALQKNNKKKALSFVLPEKRQEFEKDELADALKELRDNSKAVERLKTELATIERVEKGLTTTDKIRYTEEIKGDKAEVDFNWMGKKEERPYLDIELEYKEGKWYISDVSCGLY